MNGLLSVNLVADRNRVPTAIRLDVEKVNLVKVRHTSPYAAAGDARAQKSMQMRSDVPTPVNSRIRGNPAMSELFGADCQIFPIKVLCQSLQGNAASFTPSATSTPSPPHTPAQ